MDNLQVLKDHYQREIDKLKDQISLNKDCQLLKDRLSAYVSGYIALSKLEQLNHIDKSKDHYHSVVIYKKKYEKVLGSQLV